MPFLALNGIPVPVELDSASRDVLEIGEMSRAEDGALRKSNQGIKIPIPIKLALLPAAEAFAWQCLILGLGHVWSFDVSVYSSKGSPLTLVDGARSAGSAKFGAAKLVLDDTTGMLSFTPVRGTGHTVMFWLSGDGGSTWNHYIQTNTALYKNGVVGVISETATLTATDSALSLASTGGADVWVDDLVLLPFDIPESWVAALAAPAAEFSLLPKLHASGDATFGQSRLSSASAFVANEAEVMGVVSGAPLRIAAGELHQQITAVLEEV